MCSILAAINARDLSSRCYVISYQPIRLWVWTIESSGFPCASSKACLLDPASTQPMQTNSETGLVQLHERRFDGIAFIRDVVLQTQEGRKQQDLRAKVRVKLQLFSSSESGERWCFVCVSSLLSPHTPEHLPRSKKKKRPSTSWMIRFRWPCDSRLYT